MMLNGKYKRLFWKHEIVCIICSVLTPVLVLLFVSWLNRKIANYDYDTTKEVSGIVVKMESDEDFELTVDVGDKDVTLYVDGSEYQKYTNGQSITLYADEAETAYRISKNQVALAKSSPEVVNIIVYALIILQALLWAFYSESYGVQKCVVSFLILGLLFNFLLHV
jgi:hypothetical protein